MDALLTTQEIETKTECPTCLASGARFSFRKGQYDLYTCPQCAFLFVHPFPSNDQITDYYQRHYRGATDAFYPKSGSRRRRAFTRSLRYLPYIFAKDVLDIGCGGGFMVEAFSRFSKTSHGLDISENSIAYAKNHFRNCKFFCEDFQHFQNRNQTYDFVFSSEVLEHLPGAAAFMRTLAKIVRPGGYVYISAPDAGHREVPSNIEQWGDICPPEHLEFFDSKNLEILFSQYGFKQHRRFRSKTPAHSVIFRKTQE